MTENVTAAAGAVTASGARGCGGPEVELRIHGVSGTPPESTLRCRHAVQVAGDDKGRIYYPADELGNPLDADGAPLTLGDTPPTAADSGTPPDEGRPARPTSTRVLEAYHWGGYTAGSWIQGLWLVLIPFGFLNSAQFMLPRPREGDWLGTVAHAVCGAMLRLISLCMTGVFTFTLAYILGDLLAWQKFPEWIDDLRGRTWEPFEWLPVLYRNEFCVAVALAIAFFLIFLLSRLAKQGATRAGDPKRLAPPAEVGESLLQQRGFLGGDHTTPILRNLHLAFAALVIAVIADRLSGWNQVLEYVTEGALGVVVLVVVVLGDPERSAALDEGDRWLTKRLWTVLHRLSGPIRLGTIGLLAVALWGLSTSDVPDQATRLERFDGTAVSLLAYSLLGLPAFLAAIALLAWRTWPDKGVRPEGSDGQGAERVPDAFRPYAYGTTAYWVASAGFFLGLGFSAAAAEGAAQLLRTSEKSAILVRISNAWGITVLLAAVLALVLAVLFGVRAKARAAYVRDLYYPGAQNDTDPASTAAFRIPQRWLDNAVGAVGMARQKNCLPPILVLFGVVALLLTVAAGHDMIGIQNIWRHLVIGEDRTDGVLPGRLGWASREADPAQFNAVIWIGTWTLVVLAGRLVMLGRGAVTGKSDRRLANTIWDVFCFWPHSAHPFAPPPYSTYVVLDIRDRIRYHLTDPQLCAPAPGSHRRRILIVGHSQGSLIAFAALLWLSPAERRHVALLTCGSQLQIIFSRAFPGYVNYPTIKALFDGAEGLGRKWVNLYRDTDPIAGPVLSWIPGPVGSWRDAEARKWYHHIADPERSFARAEARTGPGNRRRERGNDWLLLDPTPVRNRHTEDPPVEGLQDGAIEKLRGHSDFASDLSWAEAVHFLRCEPPTPPEPREPAVSAAG
ncbi:hypothetical protein ACTD5D_25595 [Nocardia takedensis]|uniref:hypothetical protein n=1 Tax=Nocardia takedensis TaxID=259390 RepID=UPI0012F6553E|nr:hypothetical protein [Nocardia takedensis]